MIQRPVLAYMASLILFVVSGCASQAKDIRAPVSYTPTTVDADCSGARLLERDLSNEGVYQGDAQVYLNEQGASCRYSR